jgi:hypothetical protein
MKRLLIGAALAALLISGCATVDKDVARAQADAATAQGNARVAEAQAAAEEARAVIALSAKVDAGGASAYLVAKALKGIGGAQPAQVVQVQQPQSLFGLAWQSALQVADVLVRGYGIKATRDVGIVQSNNQAATTIASYGAFGQMGSSIERAGTAGYPYVQAPQPNITNTLSGTGVLGSGSYVGPVTTTRTCNGGVGAAGGTGGTGTTTGGAGAPGGTANGGVC